jgi:hypothetical protein
MKAPSASIALDQAAVAALAQKFHHNDFEWIYSSKAIDPDWKTRTDRPLSGLLQDTCKNLQDRPLSLAQTSFHH